MCSCSITKRRYLKGFYFVQKSQVSSKPKTVFEKRDKQNTLLTDTIKKLEYCEKNALSYKKEKIIDVEIYSELLERKTKNTSFTFNPLEDIKPYLKTEKTDPENSYVQKPLSLFWILLVLVLILYLAVIIFAADSLLPLGHLVGIVFAGLLLLWLLRVF
jgi:hypothetical protein